MWFTLAGDATTPLTRLNFSDDMNSEIETHPRAALEALKALGSRCRPYPLRWYNIIEEAALAASLYV